MKLVAALAFATFAACAEDVIEVQCREHRRNHVVDLEGSELRESLEPVPGRDGRHRFTERFQAYLNALPLGLDLPVWLVPPPQLTPKSLTKAKPIVVERGSAEFATTAVYRPSGEWAQIEGHYRGLVEKRGFRSTAEGWAMGGEKRPVEVRQVSWSRGGTRIGLLAMMGDVTVIYQERRTGAYRPAPEPRLEPETFDGRHLYLRDRTDGSEFRLAHDVIDGVDQARPMPVLAKALMPAWLSAPVGCTESFSHGSKESDSAEYQCAASPAAVIRYYRDLFARQKATISGEDRRLEDGDTVLGLSARDPATGFGIVIQASTWEGSTTLSVQHYRF